MTSPWRLAPPTARQHGVAVITALLLTTLAITIVASLFWQQQVQVRSIENQRLQLQKQWILRGALDWAALILREDAKYSNTDTLDEPWSVPLSKTRLDQYVENNRADPDAGDATVSGSIVDAQSRYNLTNLASNGVVNQAEVLVFERLLTNARLDPSLAPATAQAIADTQRRVQGAAGSNATSAAPGSQSRALPLTQVEDLLAVPGFSVEALAKLSDFVILLPRAAPVNANTAAPEVLAARIASLSVSEATALAARRKTASFRDMADVSQQLQGRTGGLTEKELSVATNFFLVNGEVSMNRAGLEVQALVERKGTITKLIWIREH